MTIPTLTANYKKKVIETRLAKFYSTINQAMKLSSVDNGEFATWELFETEAVRDDNGDYQYTKTINSLDWFNKYLAPYIKITKIEELENDQHGSILIYLQDGSMFAFNAASWLYYPFASDYEETIKDEETGITDRNRDFCGIKYFSFFFSPSVTHSSMILHAGKGMEPYIGGWDGTKEDLLNNSSIGCNIDATNERAYCTKLIQLNNWKIPKDYPLKF